VRLSYKISYLIIYFADSCDFSNLILFKSAHHFSSYGKYEIRMLDGGMQATTDDECCSS